ncbi:hypothetical protein EYZ11_008960 [Aspergillus tanneri]|uniref:Uncharacterized protein n=1 Tax=Aspergillus tanneri TaxID=1220188 RepID=A0A4S3J9J3_9EURO|nr:uncharacterized protein ATNIH1004_011081 [Aspergillus tanneri]KAA8642140.1 hypothetical protein ATNIH1004_011081 [Aspergillus tanneri]THC91565.1 hypothetical protein EYZ11_008960 [Aspergillus tanneri]
MRGFGAFPAPRLLSMSLYPGVLRLSALPSRSRPFASLPAPARASCRPHRLRQPLVVPNLRPYSSSPPRPPSSNTSHYDRSQFKVLPIIAIIGLGTGSYVFLVKSRTGVRKPQPESKSFDQ